MAEDVEVNADEGVIDKVEGSEQSEEKTSFLKSKLFKIIVSVIALLIIGGSAYFFLVAKEEPEKAASETTAKEIASDEGVTAPDESDANELENIATDTASTSEADDVQNADTTLSSVIPEPVESTKVTTALQEENVRMQQQINDLKAQISQKDKLIQDQSNTQKTTEIAPIRNSNSVDYQQDFFDDSSMREPNRTPPPKPSWGEFDRINKK